MKNKLVILMLLALVGTLTYSQTTYPKQIVLNNDTLIAITPIQLKATNKIFANEVLLKGKIKLVEKRLQYTNSELIVLNNKATELNKQCADYLDKASKQRKEIVEIKGDLIKQKAKSKRRGWSLVGTVALIIILL